MGFLDGGFLGGSSPAQIQTQTTSSAPWAAQQPYLKEIFTGAQEAFRGDQPSYYPESTVVGFAPQTEQALRMTEERALGGSPLQQAALQQAQQTVEGGYLGMNPFLQGAITQAAEPIIEQWQTEIAPGIASQFSGAGRMGSGLYGQARGRGEETLAKGLTGMAGQMAYRGYEDERARQQAMIGQAPGLAQAEYADIGKLMGVGGAREQQQALELQDAINRYEFEQQRPWEQLARYSGLVGGGYGQETTSATPLYSSPAAGFLGGALGGAQLGQMTGMGAGMGAGLGGLLGLLG
ncbi:MAG: hypothetical protein KAS66_05320 [Candidatus Omnitrophica bacterium]|nr:hypothetical protein [Candidatus Omnitrophota bacterium]